MDIVSYTNKSLIEEIALAEKHLNDYQCIKSSEFRTAEKCAVALSKGEIGRCKLDDDTAFCLDCLAKHAITISGLAKEGVRYIPDDDIYAEVAKVADELYNDLPQFDTYKADTYIEAFRVLRKALVSKHLKCEHCHIR